jgi:hypothetical protein
MSESATQRQQVFDYVYAMLGGGIVDVELDPIHYNTALDKALSKYRQRGENSIEDSYVTMTLVTNQNEYILPKEIVEVRQIFRRSVGARSGNGDGSSIFEPFNLAYTNTYLMTGSSLGGLLTYELFAQRQELVGRMFGSFIEFRWNTASKKLTVLQRPRATEEVLLWCYNYRPDSQLLTDYLASQWIKDYTLATCKYMLGEAREKFSTLAGPQGGTSLNGASLKAEAQSEMEKLDIELATSVAGGTGYGFIIG